MATYDEVFAERLEFFKGDELAASVFATKYALQDEEGNFLETNPDPVSYTHLTLPTTPYV